MTCEEFEELSGALALDAVTPVERQAAEAHLATCTRCTHLFKELRKVVTLLPLSVPQVNPSPALKERILAAIRQENRRIKGQPGGLSKRQRWTQRILVAAVVLMLCLFSGMTAWNISLNHQVTALQEQVTSLSAYPGNATGYIVRGTYRNKGVRGQLFYDSKLNITVLTVSGLPQLQGVQVYQGWLAHLNGTRFTDISSIGLLNIRNGSATLSFSGNVTGYDATIISMEPGPTATPTTPKGDVVALGSL
jgi:Anti-sigma-K factor rskA, C-terminal/Putative zinc-finger